MNWKFVILLLVLSVPVSMLGQAGTGSIVGVITDPSGAVVPGATVTGTNDATGAVRKAETTDSGNYAVPNLAPGSYTVHVDKAGFRTIVLNRVQVSTSLSVPLNAQFQLGAAQETVSVTTDTLAPVETQDSQVSNLVDSERMRALPLITRNPYELMLLSPGTAQANSSLAGVNVNGERERNNNFLLDGVDNNDTSVPGIMGGALAANPESTEEFRIITNNFNAEYGRNTGAIVDVVTKSGTNQFHGNAYWFGRYDKIGGARDWFNRASDGPRNPYVRNQFGYSIGGPIWKKKTFFFFNHELQRFRTAQTGAATVPTQEFKNGLFSFNGTDDAGNPISRTIDLRPGSADNQAFSENVFGPGAPPQIPADTIIQKIFALYPNPTQLTGDGYSGLFFFPNSSRQNSYQATAKIDHRFTDSETFSFRYGYNDFTDPDAFFDAILPNNVGATASKGIANGGAANLTSMFGSNLINSVTFGWNHIFAGFKCTGLDVLDSPFPVDRFGVGSEFILNPFTSLACGGAGTLLSDGQARTTGTISAGDTLTWVKGAHTLKFGGDFRNVDESGDSNFNSRRQVDTRLGTFTGGGFDSLGIGVSDAFLNDAVSAYYGFVLSDLNAEFFDKSGTRRANDNKDFRQRESDFYLQDSWKIRQNFTLNLGIRYQFNGVPYERNSNLANLLTDPRSFPVTFTVVGPGTGHQLFHDDYSNVEPRVGFSWDPWSDGKTAIRGSFGIFHDRVFGNLFGNARGNPPFEQDYSTNPFETIGNAFGTGAFPTIVPEMTPSLSVADGALLAPVIFDPHFRNPVTNSWFFGIQRDLPGNLVVDVNYVGNSSHYVFRVFDANPPDPALVQQLLDFCVPSNPDNHGFQEGQCTSANVASLNLYSGFENGVLPFNGVAHNAIGRSGAAAALNKSDGNANYNALQAKLTKRFAHGFQMQGSYTWAHSLDDANDPIVSATGGVSFVRDPLNPALDRGNSDHDIRHVAVINSIWELPIGTGRSYWSQGIVGRVLEGFQLSGIVTMQTGRAFDVLGTRDSLRVGRVNRANLVGDPFAPTPAGTSFTPGTKVFFTNPDDAFTNPPFDTPATIGRNFFHGPSFVNMDMSVAKRMKIGEHLGVELRLEAYNLFNHPNFNNPGDDAAAVGNQIGSPVFGQITSQIGRPDGTTGARQLQMGAKVTF